MGTAAKGRALKTRKAGTATVPTPAIHISSNATDNKLSALRVQYLRDRFGLSGPFGELVAALRWEQSHA